MGKNTGRDKTMASVLRSKGAERTTGDQSVECMGSVGMDIRLGLLQEPTELIRP